VSIIASAAVPSQYRLDRQSTHRIRVCPPWCTAHVPAGDGVIHVADDLAAPVPVRLEQLDGQAAGVRVGSAEPLTPAEAQQLAAALIRAANGRPQQPECAARPSERIEVRDALDDRLEGVTYCCVIHMPETMAAIAGTGAVARAMPVRDLEAVVPCGFVRAYVGGVAA
jgi:hypothetical protein